MSFFLILPLLHFRMRSGMKLLHSLLLPTACHICFLWRERHFPLASFVVEIKSSKKFEEKRKRTLRRSLLKSFFLRQMRFTREFQSFSVSWFLERICAEARVSACEQRLCFKTGFLCSVLAADQICSLKKKLMLLFCVGISFTFWLCACEVHQVLYFSKQGKSGMH